MTIWMDLTNSLTQNKGNVVGIVRAELMLAKYLHEIDSSIRFSVLTKYGFRKVNYLELRWLFKSKNINDDYIKYQKRKKRPLNKFLQKIGKKIAWEIFRFKRHYIKPRDIPGHQYIVYPYHKNDIVYSCGWIKIDKEDFFSKIVNRVSGFKVVYTIYDLCMITGDMKYLYCEHNEPFVSYLYWIANNCSAIIYGGKTAKKDAEEFFIEKDLPRPVGYPVKWGNDFAKIMKKSDVLERLNLKTPYILSVGSIDFKKNYKVIYRAYCMMKQKNMKNIPQLVIVGRFTGGDPDFESMIQTNPLIKDCIKIVSCSDEDLDTLYKNCLFTVLPTLYEDWSLTLPESFYYGKMCVCSDVEPLREVGGDFAYYINPQHPKDWVDNIMHFVKHPEKIKEYENKIHKYWKSVSWKESAQEVYSALKEVSGNQKNQTQITEIKVNKAKNSKPVLYYDICLLSYLSHGYNSLSGIPRTQMLLARYLYKYNKNIKFFWMKNGIYHELSYKQLINLLSDQDLDVAIVRDEKNIHNCITKDILPFNKNDVIFSTWIGFDDLSYKVFSIAHEKIKFKYCQVLYDFTPITVPHCHKEETVRVFLEFLDKTYKTADFVFYGGKTAQKDGEIFQKNHGLPIIRSNALKWGSDIVRKNIPKKK